MNNPIAKTTAALAELKKATASVQAEIDKNRQDIENALQLRESIQDPPVSRDEFAETLCSVVDLAAASLPNQFPGGKLFGQALTWPMWKNSTVCHMAKSNDIVPTILSGLKADRWNSSSLPLICFLFGDRIKDLIRKIVTDMDYPDKYAGMPIDERRAAIAKLDTEIEDLQRRESEMIADAQAAGLKTDDVVLRVR